MNILYCFDSTTRLESVPKFLTLLNLPGGTQITLLCIRARSQSEKQMDLRIQTLSTLLPDFVTRPVKIVSDAPVEPILVEAARSDYDLAIISDVGSTQGFSLFSHDSTAIKLARRIEIPFLIIRGDFSKINRILFCTSAEEAAHRTFERSIPLINEMQAEITIMHVMSQVTLRVPGVDDDLLDTAESHIARKTREGQHLAWAVNFLAQSGQKGLLTPRLRYGLVLDEVIAEINENKVDLLIIGSHHRPGQSRLMEFILEDVARDLLREVSCSVLLL